MIPEYDRFCWKEVRSGRWERDIDEAEQYYTSHAKAEGCRRTPSAITGHVSFSVATRTECMGQEAVQQVVKALQKAWVRLRYDHPTIASWVEYDQKAMTYKKLYETFQNDENNSDQKSWLEDTFRIIISSGKSGQQWCNSDPPVPKLPTLYLINLSWSRWDQKITSDLVLRCPHGIIDGIGTLQLLNSFFAHASRFYEQEEAYDLPQFGDECANLSPPLRIAASIPPTLSSDQKKIFNGIIKENASLRRNIELATVPFRPGVTIPGRHQRVALILILEQTKLLLIACKNLGLSVTHVYHAAVAMVVRDIQERHAEERTVRYISHCIINERGHCKEPYNTQAHAASVYHSVSCRHFAIDLVVPAAPESKEDHAANEGQSRRDFMRIARQAKDFYLRIHNDKERIAMIPSYWMLSMIPYPDASDTGPPTVPRPNSLPSVSISSMGDIDKVLGSRQGAFELENPWVTGDELGTEFGLFLGTFKGEMCLSAVYNDAWYSREDVTEFVNQCNNMALGCLGI
ncbi:hypothetical protein AJ80_09711 [Polytolypa hystricis UAMH7299]|uniref:Condensation domain-containing protein n=1 Tax=Polytolypa hystricis (strain UAMH7299) TaxID=1447883 RepID=A0A2B7WLI6_POLH7|nr:hypothetical protein AJ80_09711 [Polytolypa hystricis UAMH7299]